MNRFSRRHTGWIVGILCIVLLGVSRDIVRPVGAQEEGHVDDELRPIQFTGRALDDQGRAMGGVGVHLRTLDVGRNSLGQSMEPTILDQTKSNEASEFALTLPQSWRQIPHTLRQEVTLAAVDGDRRGELTLARHSVPPESGLTLTVRHDGVTRIRVVTPERTPLADARVRVSARMSDLYANGMDHDAANSQARQFGVDFIEANGGYIFPASGKAVLNEAEYPVGTTDELGEATLHGIAPAHVGMVEVDHPRFGKQAVGYVGASRDLRDTSWPETIVLLPTASVTVRAQSPAGDDLSQTQVVVSTNNYDQATGLVRLGTARGALSKEGRVEFPAVAVGPGQIVLEAPAWLHLGASPHMPFALQPGQPTTVDVPLVNLVRVRGRVVDGKTGRGIPGPLIAFFNQRMTLVQTDENGEFLFDAAPGEIGVVPYARPGYFAGEVTPTIVELAAGANEFMMKDIVMSPLESFAGSVVDDQERPIVAARVTASWKAFSPRFGNVRDTQVSAATDDAGHFDIGRLPTTAEVKLSATHAGLTRAVTFGAADWLNRHVTIRLTADSDQPLRGQVVDAQRNPLAGARVEIFRRQPLGAAAERQTSWSAARSWPVAPHVTVTDAQGNFVSPPVAAAGEYQVVVRAAGYVTRSSQWRDVTRIDGFHLPTIQLEPVRGIPGTVRDRQGRGIPEARVAVQGGESYTETSTDEQGVCQIPITESDGVLVFVDHPEHTFCGELLRGSPERWEATLDRRGDAPPEPYLRTHLPLTWDERRQLASELVEPLIPLLNADNVATDTLVALGGAVARARPEWVEPYLAAHPSLDGMVRANLRHCAFVSSKSADPADYLQHAEDGYGYLFACLDALQRMDDADDRLVLLGDAAARIRGIEQPEFRTVGFGILARQLDELGQRDDARALLREGQTLAEKLPTAGWTGYARAALATELSVIDADAALALIANLPDANEHARHHTNMAVRLASVDPAMSETAWSRIRPPQPNQFDFREVAVVRIVFRMASADLARADRLIAPVQDPITHAYAVGASAAGLVSSNSMAARQRFQAAFDQLAQAAHVAIDPAQVQRYQPSAVALSLLPYVEQLDPALVREFFWRSMSLWPRQTKDTLPPQDAWRYDSARLILTMLATRYEQDTAEWCASQLARTKSAGRDDESLVVRMLIQPQAVRQAMAERPDLTRLNFVIRQAVSALTRPDERFWLFANRFAQIERLDADDLTYDE